MKKLLLFTTTFVLLFVTSLSPAFAQYDFRDGCTSVGECKGNYKCVVKETIEDRDEITQVIGLSTEPNCNSSAIGGVKAPPGVAIFDNSVVNGGGGNASTQNIGLILFISNLLKVFALIAGIWAMFNMVMAGYTYITSMSDAGVTEKVKNNLTMTVIGLALIAGAYIIAGVIGALMFGDANFILQPHLYSALQSTP